MADQPAMMVRNEHLTGTTAGNLVSSREARELAPVAAAHKTMAQDNVRRESVAAHFSEEWKETTSTEMQVRRVRSVMARVPCTRASADIVCVTESKNVSGGPTEDHDTKMRGDLTETGEGGSHESLLL